MGAIEIKHDTFIYVFFLYVFVKPDIVRAMAINKCFKNHRTQKISKYCRLGLFIDRNGNNPVINLNKCKSKNVVSLNKKESVINGIRTYDRENVVV